jgi:hypothetical protein
MPEARLGAETIRVARIAHEALRKILFAGDAPTPEAFARAYADVERGSGAPTATPDPSPGPRVFRVPGDLRRATALLSAALATLGAGLPPRHPQVEACIDLAARLLASADATLHLDAVERTLAAIRDAGDPTLPWRGVLADATRHLASVLPPDAEVALDLLRARSQILQAENEDLRRALERLGAILKRSVLQG